MNGIPSLYQMTPTGVPFRTGARGESTSEQRYFVPGFSTAPGIPLTPEQQADRMMAAQRSSGASGYDGEPTTPSPFSQLPVEEQANFYALNPTMAAVTQTGQNLFGLTSLGMLQAQLNPSLVAQQQTIAQGINPNLATPVAPPAQQDVSPIAPVTTISPDVVAPGIPVTDLDVNVDPTAALAVMNQQQQEEDTASPAAVAADVAADVAASIAAQDVDASMNVQDAPAPAPAPSDTSVSSDVGGGGSTPSIGDQQSVDSNMNVQDAPDGGGDGGGTSCFLTTAAVKHMGQKDNGEVLNTLRSFRDTYMKKDKEKNKDVQWYYTNAPRIMRALDARDDAGPVYREMYNDYVIPAYRDIKAGKNAEAYTTYKKLVNFAKRESGIENEDLTPKPKHYMYGGQVMNYNQGGVASLANRVQEKGRGQDTMLVHMTPKEVGGLQALAMAHGGSLTINPQTGLPEAGFLSSILPMVAGAALAPFTGGLSAALLVGGGYGLATGSLSKGLMAGLGAFGGAGLGSALSAAGAASATAPALTGTAPGLAQAGAVVPQAAMSAAPGSLQAALPTLSSPISTAASAAAPAAASTFAPAAAPVTFGNMASGIPALGTEAGRTAAMSSLGGGMGAIKTVGMAAAPILAGGFDEPAGLPIKDQYIRPFKYKARPSAEEDADFRYRTGERGESTGEQRYFGSTYTPVGVYKAGTEPAYGTYAMGGDIEEGVKNGNIRSFDDEYGQDEYAGGGLTAFKAGGLQDGGFVVPADVVAHLGNGSTDAGLRLLAKTLKAKPIKGDGDGMSDSIPTTIGGKQPARVADGEAYISPEVTKKVGSERLYKMMERIRKAKTGKERQAPEINTREYVPA